MKFYQNKSAKMLSMDHLVNEMLPLGEHVPIVLNATSKTKLLPNANYHTYN